MVQEERNMPGQLSTNDNSHSIHSELSSSPFSKTDFALELVNNGQSNNTDSCKADGLLSGFVALVGRPNAGKSCLLNALVGSKVAISSRTAQTTRKNVQAVLTSDVFQIVFTDTPGLHKPHDELGKCLNNNALSGSYDADVVVMLIDSSQSVGTGDAWVAKQLENFAGKKICVLSKSDLSTPKQIEQQKRAAEELCEWDSFVVLSSKKGENLGLLIEEICRFLPKGPLWYPADTLSTAEDEEVIAELIREKILRQYRDEIPHSVAVSIDDFSFDSRRTCYHIYASIFVERESQKGILIGKDGAALKKVGCRARKDIEKHLDAHVFLDLKVKVKRKWRKNEADLERFGYKTN